MKIPLLPGPADLVSAAEGLRDLVTESLALVPRVVTAVGQVELLLDRVAVLLARVEAVVDRAEDAVAGVAATKERADAAIRGVESTRTAADAAISGVEGTRRAADALVTEARGTRANADDLDPHEVEALVTLVDRLPTLVAHLDEDVLPVLASLDNVAPDVHALLDTVQDLRELAKGFPGSKLFRRRGAEEIAEEEGRG